MASRPVAGSRTRIDVLKHIVGSAAVVCTVLFTLHTLPPAGKVFLWSVWAAWIALIVASLVLEYRAARSDPDTEGRAQRMSRVKVGAMLLLLAAAAIVPGVVLGLLVPW